MAADWIKYAYGEGTTRNQPISPDLAAALAFLPQMGLGLEVFTGGQDPAGPGARRTGSVRHDHGGAADVFFTRNGQRLDWANAADLPVIQDIVRQAKANGVTGFGAGPGYMQPGSMHVGFGAPAVWGAGGKGANAPDWLREAYGAAPAGQVPTTPSGNALSFGAGVPDGAPAADLGMLASVFQPMPAPMLGTPLLPQPGQMQQPQETPQDQREKRRRDERLALADMIRY